MKISLVVKYIDFYSDTIRFIRTTLWQGVITQMYAEQLYSGSYRTAMQRPLALAPDGDIL